MEQKRTRQVVVKGIIKKRAFADWFSESMLALPSGEYPMEEQAWRYTCERVKKRRRIASGDVSVYLL